MKKRDAITKLITTCLRGAGATVAHATPVLPVTAGELRTMALAARALHESDPKEYSCDQCGAGCRDFRGLVGKRTCIVCISKELDELTEEMRRTCETPADGCSCAGCLALEAHIRDGDRR